MHTILKSILKLISLTGIYFIPSYAYSTGVGGGEIDMISQKTMLSEYDAASLNVIDYFTGHEDESIDHNRYKLHVILSVKQIERRVLATLGFINRDKRDLFIHRRLLPINSTTDEPYFFSPLCQNAFSIIMDNSHHLEFIPPATNICEYIGDDDNDDLYIGGNNDIKTEWVRVPSGESITFNVNLNDAYYFPPGNHWYEINSLRYRISSDKWFLQRSTNNLMFFIINFHYPSSCQRKSEGLYIQELNSLCESDYSQEENSITYFIHKFFPGGGKNQNYIDITSSQIRIKLNGDDVKSYKETKVELLKKRYGAQWEKYWF